MKHNYQIVNQIKADVMDLSDEESKDILELLNFHECEPMAAAERVAEYLSEMSGVKVQYEVIFDML